MTFSREKLNVFLMSDSGKSRRIRMRRSHFKFFLIFFLLCPFLVLASIAALHFLWEENKKLQLQVLRLEEIHLNRKATTERLSHLESLLDPKDNMQNLLAQNIAVANEKKIDSGAGSATNNSQGKVEKESDNSPKTTDKDEKLVDVDGPGHAEFPVLDTKEIIVQNVTSLLSAKRRLRTSFDLHNESGGSITGEVFCILSLSSGKTIRLTPTPGDAGTYKITRYKKAVLLTDIAPDISMENAQLVLEIKNDKNVEIFRNIYPISQ